MEVQGRIISIGSTKQVTDKFKTRDLVIQNGDEKYPQYNKFEATQDKVSILDAVSVGDEVTVHFNLNGRQWKDKTGECQYFNQLQVWKIDGGTQQQYKAPDIMPTDDSEDLPF